MSEEEYEFICSDCRSVVQQEATVCPKCGASLEESQETKKQSPVSSSDRWDTQQHVEDETAPLLYSKKAIYFFSFWFSVLFGAALMVLNLRTLKKPEGVVPTISFSISYFVTITIIWDYLELQLNRSIPASGLVSLLGGVLIQKFIWDKYIGKEIKYRKRRIVTPLIIGVLLGTLILIVLIKNQ